jgi:hypothetical protein
MFLRLSRRLRTSLLVVMTTLFSQLALANYICPTGSSTVDSIMEMAPGEPCEGMASDQDRSGRDAGLPEESIRQTTGRRRAGQPRSPARRHPEGALLRVRQKAMTVAVVMGGLLPILLGTGTGSEVMLASRRAHDFRTQGIRRVGTSGALTVCA